MLDNVTPEAHHQYIEFGEASTDQSSRTGFFEVSEVYYINLTLLTRACKNVFVG